MKPDFEVDERWEVTINFTDEVMPKVERVSGYADNTEMFKLYWYEKYHPENEISQNRIHAEYIPLFTIKNIEFKSL